MERHAAHDSNSTDAVPSAVRPSDVGNTFYLICHDHVTGAPRLHTSTIGLGAAGGMLAESLLAGQITLDTGLVTAVDLRPAAPDDLDRRSEREPETTAADTVWAQVVAEPWRHPVRTWLTVLSSQAPQIVADRLTKLGHLQATGSRRRSRRAAPTDWKFAEWAAARLRVALIRGIELTVADVAVLALLDASGLHHFILDGLEPSARDYHAYLLAGLPRAHPDVAEVTAHTQAAVADAVLARGHR